MSLGMKKLATIFGGFLVVLGAWFYLQMPGPKIAGLDRPQLTLSTGVETAAAPGAKKAVRPGGKSTVRKPRAASPAKKRKTIRDRRANRARTRLDRTKKAGDNDEEVNTPRSRRPVVRPQGMKRRSTLKRAPMNSNIGAIGMESGEAEGPGELLPEEELPPEEGEEEIPPEQYEQEGMQEIM